MGIFDAARGERVSDDVLARLKRVSTATAWGFLTTRHSIRRPFMMGIRPLSIGDVFPLAGRARTLRYVPLREDLLALLRSQERDQRLGALLQPKHLEALVIETVERIFVGPVFVHFL